MGYKRILIIGLDCHDTYDVLKKQFQDPDSLVIGNGKRKIKLDELEDLKNVDEDALIMINAHGNVSGLFGGKHNIYDFIKNKELTSDVIIEICKRIPPDRKVHFHIHSCHSGALNANEVTNLPDGSTITCFSNPDHTVFFFDAIGIMEIINKRWDFKKSALENTYKLLPIMHFSGNLSISKKDKGQILNFKSKTYSYPLTTIGSLIRVMELRRDAFYDAFYLIHYNIFNELSDDPIYKNTKNSLKIEYPLLREDMEMLLGHHFISSLDILTKQNKKEKAEYLIKNMDPLFFRENFSMKYFSRNSMKIEEIFINLLSVHNLGLVKYGFIKLDHYGLCGSVYNKLNDAQANELLANNPNYFNIQFPDPRYGTSLNLILDNKKLSENTLRDIIIAVKKINPDLVKQKRFSLTLLDNALIRFVNTREKLDFSNPQSELLETLRVEFNNQESYEDIFLKVFHGVSEYDQPPLISKLIDKCNDAEYVKKIFREANYYIFLPEANRGTIIDLAKSSNISNADKIDLILIFLNQFNRQLDQNYFEDKIKKAWSPFMEFAAESLKPEDFKKFIVVTNPDSYWDSYYKPSDIKNIKENIVTIAELSDPDTLTKKDKDGNTPLHKSIEYNHPEVSIALIRKMPPDSLDITNNQNQTPLEIALEKNSKSIAKELIQKGADTSKLQTKHHHAINQIETEINQGMVRSYSIAP